MGSGVVSYNVGNYQELIDALTDAKRKTDEITEKVTNILITELAGQGITGSIADALVDKFNQAIKPIFENFSQSSEIFINKNQEVMQAAEINTQKSTAAF